MDKQIVGDRKEAAIDLKETQGNQEDGVEGGCEMRREEGLVEDYIRAARGLNAKNDKAEV